MELDIIGGSWYVGKIIIDSREKVRGYNAYRYYEGKYNVHVEKLKYGDYSFLTRDGKEIVFEFKNTKDFVNSMENKTLFNELANQSIHYQYSYLIVCGDFNETYEYYYWNVPHYRYKYKTLSVLKNRLNSQVNGAFNRILAMYVPIIFVDNEDEAFEKMLKVALKVADNKKYGGVTRPITKQLEQDPNVLWLSGLENIGEKKSRSIIESLDIKCLDDLCNRKPVDFLSVNRVTEENVREIWRRIHNKDLIDMYSDS